MASHEHLSSAGIREGEDYTYTRRQITLQGVVGTTETKQVERVTGGGFYGSVVIFPDSVMKTTTPGNLQELLRRINWPVPFPSRSSETAAELDSLAGHIIHLATPPLTDNKIITPDSLGFSHPSQELGYAQHLERMHGRGTVFLDNGKENRQIREAREAIWGLRDSLGSEDVAQAHPDNPYGKPNLWLSDSGQIIWLDYLPAFRHTGRVKPVPFVNYPFHKEVQEAFGSEQPTYNRLHTGILRKTLQREESKFGLEDRRELEDLLVLYDERWQTYEAWMSQNPRELFIQDAYERGLIDRGVADLLRHSDFAYHYYQANEIAKLGVHAFLDKVRESPLRIFRDADFARNVVKFFTNSEYHHKQVLEHTALWGLKKARDHGLVSDEEYDEALSFVPPNELRTYLGLQTAYIINSRVVDAATVFLAAAAARSEQPMEAAQAVAAFNIFAPGIIRALMTVMVDRLSDVELKKAALISTIPVVGNYTAIPIQMRSVYGEKGEKIMHYTIRALVATLSKMNPSGGWNSDFEERIWNAIYKQDPLNGYTPEEIEWGKPQFDIFTANTT